MNTAPLTLEVIPDKRRPFGKVKPFGEVTSVTFGDSRVTHFLQERHEKFQKVTSVLYLPEDIGHNILSFFDRYYSTWQGKERDFNCHGFVAVAKGWVGPRRDLGMLTWQQDGLALKSIKTEHVSRWPYRLEVGEPYIVKSLSKVAIHSFLGVDEKRILHTSGYQGRFRLDPVAAAFRNYRSAGAYTIQHLREPYAELKC